MSNERKPVTLGTKLGYGVAQIGDALVYAIMVVYLMYYLTSVAHLDAGTAGTISSVALFISAVVTFFIGYFSDNSKSKTGRRRPFIKVALPFIFVSFIALYSSFGLTGTTAVLYYGFFTILFWVSYCTFFVPYTALGAEITSDYSERTSVRAYAAVGTQIGNFSGSVFPLIIVGGFVAVGLSQSLSWTLTAAIIVTISVIVISIMLKSTKGRELIIEDTPANKKGNMFKDYFDVIKAKPTKFLILAIICFIIVNSIFASNLAFFIIYKLELPDSYVSTIMAVIFIIAIPMAPVINVIAQKLDKRRAFILLFLLSAALLILFRFIGVDNIYMLGALAIAYVISNASYWQLISATLYDVAEVVELTTGKRYEGTLASLQSITQQIGSGIAMLIMGWFLQLNGFSETAASQTPQALDAINTLQTVIPGILLIAGAVMIWLFPINKSKYELIQKALVDKEKTGSFSREGLERII